MKKTFTFLSLIILCLSFVTCGSSGGGGDVVRIKVQAGKLGEYLQSHNLKEVTDLKINGSLNFNDFSSLSTLNKLTYLDIRDVDIKGTSYNESVYKDNTLYADFFHQSLATMNPNLPNLKTIILPRTLTTLESSTFENYNYLSDVQIQTRLLKIGQAAFADCTALDKIAIPANVTTIESMAFADCILLREITLPAGLTTLERSLFEDCSGLREITLPAGLKNIQPKAFSGAGITTIQIPANVTEIAHNAFRDCVNMTNIDLPEKLETIDNEAFKGCTSLTKIVLPANVRIIGEEAFAQCPFIAVVAMMTQPTTNAEVLFSGQSIDCILYVGNSESISAYETAKGWQGQFKAVIPFV